MGNKRKTLYIPLYVDYVYTILIISRENFIQSSRCHNKQLYKNTVSIKIYNQPSGQLRHLSHVQTITFVRNRDRERKNFVVCLSCFGEEGAGDIRCLPEQWRGETPTCLRAHYLITAVTRMDVGGTEALSAAKTTRTGRSNWPGGKREKGQGTLARERARENRHRTESGRYAQHPELSDAWVIQYRGRRKILEHYNSILVVKHFALCSKNLIVGKIYVTRIVKL